MVGPKNRSTEEQTPSIAFPVLLSSETWRYATNTSHRHIPLQWWDWGGMKHQEFRERR